MTRRTWVESTPLSIKDGEESRERKVALGTVTAEARGNQVALVVGTAKLAGLHVVKRGNLASEIG